MCDGFFETDVRKFLKVLILQNQKIPRITHLELAKMNLV